MYHRRSLSHAINIMAFENNDKTCHIQSPPSTLWDALVLKIDEWKSHSMYFYINTYRLGKMKTTINAKTKTKILLSFF